MNDPQFTDLMRAVVTTAKQLSARERAIVAGEILNTISRHLEELPHFTHQLVSHLAPEVWYWSQRRTISVLSEDGPHPF